MAQYLLERTGKHEDEGVVNARLGRAVRCVTIILGRDSS